MTSSPGKHWVNGAIATAAASTPSALKSRVSTGRTPLQNKVVTSNITFAILRGSFFQIGDRSCDNTCSSHLDNFKYTQRIGKLQVEDDVFGQMFSALPKYLKSPNYIPSQCHAILTFCHFASPDPYNPPLPVIDMVHILSPALAPSNLKCAMGTGFQIFQDKSSTLFPIYIIHRSTNGA